MTREYWIAVSVGALILGFFIGYIIWGPSAGKLPEVEKQLRAAEAQLAEARKNSEKMEGNLGKLVNEKLNLEKENAELKQAIEKATKARR
ncbi:MAG TPA: hypothetical protein VNL14_22245 [Candidatus Acidoferrales bacterium]|nr:hypothetical protein [Candidatus Acidoferrales bacterium]